MLRLIISPSIQQLMKYNRRRGEINKKYMERKNEKNDLALFWEEVEFIFCVPERVLLEIKKEKLYGLKKENICDESEKVQPKSL